MRTGLEDKTGAELLALAHAADRMKRATRRLGGPLRPITSWYLAATGLRNLVDVESVARELRKVQLCDQLATALEMAVVSKPETTGTATIEPD